MDRCLDDPEWLRLEYESKSLQEIADDLGCHRNTVRERFERFGIQRRGRTDQFKGVPKSPEHRAKLAQKRKDAWDHCSPDERAVIQVKMSQGRTKTGTRDGRPYVYVIGRGYVPEHIVVMENKLGRRLLPGEHVHHIDEDKTNNSPDNLTVLTNSEHRKLHAKTQQRDGSGVFTKKS